MTASNDRLLFLRWALGEKPTSGAVLYGWTYTPPTDKDGPGIWGKLGPFASVEELAVALEKASSTAETHASLCWFALGGAADTASVICRRIVSLDFDTKCLPGASAAQRFRRARMVLEHLPASVVVVHTGHGFHLHLLLPAALWLEVVDGIDAEDGLKRIQRIERALRIYLEQQAVRLFGEVKKFDHAHGAQRAWRVPPTVNMKVAESGKVMTADPSRWLPARLEVPADAKDLGAVETSDLQFLAPYIDAADQEMAYGASLTSEDIEAVSADAGTFDLDMLPRWLMRDWPLATGDSSAQDFRLACVLLKEGQSKGIAGSAIRARRDALGDAKGDRKDYVARTVRAAAAAVEREKNKKAEDDRKNNMDPNTVENSAPQSEGKAPQSNATKVADAIRAAVVPEDNEPIKVRAWPAPPGGEAFYGLPGRFVRAIAPQSESDEIALLVQVMVALGALLGRGPHARAEADRHGTNLFVCLVGRTAKGRKGTSWGHARRLCEEVDRSWSEKRIMNGLASGEGLISAVRDPMPARGKGKDDPGEPDKRLLVSEGEFAATLKVASRDGNTLSPTIRSAWDTGNLHTMTKGNPSKATGAHICIIGHITRDELLRELSRIEGTNGFGNRFLWICVRRSKELPFGGRLDPMVWNGLVAEATEAVKYSSASGEVVFDHAARAVWIENYHHLSRETPGLLGAMLGRAEAQVLRLALLYAVLDKADAIGVAHLRAALALWDYAARSAAYIFGDASGNPLADKLLTALRDAPDGLTRTEIRDVLGRHEKAADVNRALAVLLEAGQASFEMEKTEGRSRERWRAHVLPVAPPSVASVASVAVAAGETSSGAVPAPPRDAPLSGSEVSPVGNASASGPGDRSDSSDGSPRVTVPVVKSEAVPTAACGLHAPSSGAGPATEVKCPFCGARRPADEAMGMCPHCFRTKGGNGAALPW